MNKKLLLLPLLLLFSLFTYGQMNGDANQWYNSTFVIGSFADPRVSRTNETDKDAKSFSLAKAAGINLLLGPQYYNGASDFSLMDKTLTLASKYGMRVLVIDSKLLVNKSDFSTNQAGNIISYFKSVDPAKRNAMGGYYLGGEFLPKEAKQIKKWAGHFTRQDPSMLAFTYLFPYYGFNTKKQYESYLDSYLTDVDVNNRPQVVAYDYYPFLSQKILSTYFYNIALIKQKAGIRPVWYFIQSTTQKNISDITDYQMKFMAFCPLAYGSKGAIYYTYESIPENYGLNYHDALINPYGNVTKKYYTAKTINYYLSHVAGPIILKNSYMGTYHVSSAPTNEQIAAKHMLGNGNQYVRSVSNRNVLIGVFRDPSSKKYFLMFVNKSENDIANILVTVPGKKTVKSFLNSKGYGGSMEKTVLNVNSNAAGNTSIFTIPSIPGGEMTVFELN